MKKIIILTLILSCISTVLGCRQMKRANDFKIKNIELSRKDLL